MRRKGHPSFPSAMTCCFFASLKTLLIPTEAIAPLDGVNVLALSLAGFQVTLIGRFWVIPEGTALARPSSGKNLAHLDSPEVSTFPESWISSRMAVTEASLLSTFS